MVNRSLWLLNSEVVATRTNVVSRLATDLPPILMDARKLEQALLNLFINAIQAMAQHGSLQVTTRSGDLARDLQLNGTIASRFASGDRLVVAEVQDTGPGMNREQQRQAFTSPLHTTKPKGAGLGLAIVARIVEAHHGRVKILSGAGGGTIVRVRLPVWRGQKG